MPARDGVVRTVHRALILLDCLAEVDDGASIRELSRRLDLPRSTVQRLLASLEAEGLVHQHSDRASYRLSARIFRFVTKIQNRLDLRAQALPVMKRTRDLSKQSVGLMVREGDYRLCIESIDGLEPLRGFFRLGDRLPLYCGASGKLIMAQMTEEETDNVIVLTGLKPLTPNTITDPTKLKGELREIRHQGYATSYQERYQGLCSVAAPIRDYTGTMVGTLVLAGPKPPFTGTSLKSLIRIAQEAAAEISDRLGFEAEPTAGVVQREADLPDSASPQSSSEGTRPLLKPSVEANV